jgi:hypothetical protein
MDQAADSDLRRLVEEAESASPETRIEYRDRIAPKGAPAIQAVSAWISNRRLGPFAVRVIRAAASYDARAAAVLALTAGRPVAATPLIRQDIDEALQALGAVPLVNRSQPREPHPVSEVHSVSPKPHLGRYLRSEACWHLVVDELPLTGEGAPRYLAACGHWNSEVWVNRRPGMGLRDEPPRDEPFCQLCDRFAMRERDAGSRAAWSVYAEQAPDGSERRYLVTERAWHIAFGLDSYSSPAFGDVYLTECGRWVLFSQVARPGSAPRMPRHMCSRCLRFIAIRAST